MLVVGAGTAGLTAARALVNAGVETVVIEGRDRVGGRVHTETIAGAPVDMGAAWVHGTAQANPVAQALSLLGVGVSPDDADTRLFEPGTGFAPQNVLGDLYQHHTRFHNSLGSLRSQVGKRGSVDDGIVAYLDNRGLIGTERERVDFILRTSAEDSYSGAAEDMSLRWYWEDSDFGGGDGFPQGGYGAFITALTTGTTIELGQAVRRIEHDRNGVRVDTDTDTFEGTHAIVTLPIGVLKAGSVVFDPQLPKKKRKAIDRLGMGSYEKVIMRFDDAIDSLPDDHYYRSATAGEHPHFKNFTDVVGAPTLIAFSSGAFGAQVANSDPDDAGARVLTIAREMSGAAFPDPVETRVTRWTADPFSAGSYSFVGLRGKNKDRARLAAPLPGKRVLFAGEATHSEYATTVHGAMLSGIREAERILGNNVTVASLFA